MSKVVFFAERHPSSAAILELCAISPAVPSYTPAYVAARQRLGAEPWLLSSRQDDGLITGCTAFLERGARWNTLEVTTCPTVSASRQKDFWGRLVHFCREEKILRLKIGSQGSSSCAIKDLPGEIRRTSRSEHVLNLECPDVSEALVPRHAREVERALAAGIEVRRRSDRAGCDAHSRLVAASNRSQVVRAYVEEGAGRLYQAVIGERVVSSALVLMSEAGGYCESGASSAVGFESGAPHLLMLQIAKELQAESRKSFNLGGAEYAEQELRRFKSGFGTRTVPLATAEFVLGGRLRRKAVTALHLLRHHPWDLIGRTIVRAERLYVYRAAPEELPVPEERATWVFRELSDTDLQDLAQKHQIAAHALARRRSEGFNGTYGVFIGGALANITWLVTAAQDRHRPIRIVRLRPGEVEITHGHTRGGFRGRGVWPFMLGHLSRRAGELGACEVYGVHYAWNTPSQRAIEKAGYRRCGTVVRCIFPVLLAGRAITFRGHRRRQSAKR